MRRRAFSGLRIEVYSQVHTIDISIPTRTHKYRGAAQQEAHNGTCVVHFGGVSAGLLRSKDYRTTVVSVVTGAFALF